MSKEEITEKLNMLASLFAQAASALMFEHDSGLNAIQIKFRAEVQRSGEAVIDLGIGTDRPIRTDRPDCEDRPKTKKPCPHEAEAKDKKVESKPARPSSVLNDALNKLAAEVDERNKKTE